MTTDRRLRTSFVSIGVNLAQVALEGWLAWLTGSLALAADALHSLTDMAVSSVVLLGLLLRRRSERAHDGQVSTGIRRLEAGIAYAVSLLILFAPYEIVTTLLNRQPQPLRHLGPAIGGLLLCIAAAYFISRLKLMVGRETGSASLVADGYHSRMDVLSSVAVLLAVMGDAIGVRLDPIVAAVIALLIGVTGLELLVGSVRALFGGAELRTEGFEARLYGWLNRAWGAVSLRLFGRRTELPRARLPQLGGRRAMAGAAAGCLGLWGLSGTTVIGPDEIGVRTRFGRIVDPVLEPGLYLRLPWPIEKIERARPARLERVELGFRSRGAKDGQPDPRGAMKVPDEALMLAGDESLVDLNLVVHYRRRDALAELYRARSTSEIVAGLTEAIAREVLATEPADAMLAGDRERVLDRIEQQLRVEAEAHGLGIDVAAVLLADAQPPSEVTPAFRDVFSAREDQLRLLEQAEAHRNQALPAARAQSAARLTDAEGFELDKRLRAEGDAQRFGLGAAAYRRAPEVTGYRLFLETAEASLAGRKKIIANPRANRGGYHLWLFSPDKPAVSPAPAQTPPPLPIPPLAAAEEPE